MENIELKSAIFSTLNDCWHDLFYYDRKEDGGLPVYAIERAIKDGVITVDEMVEHFRKHIESEMKG